MLQPLILVLLGISPTISSALINRAIPDNTKPHGKNPIRISSAKFLGNQTADNSCSHRDLGFTGSINGKWYAIYGDTLWCAAGVHDPWKDPTGKGKFYGMVRDAVSAMTNNPLKVHDLNLNGDKPVAHQKQFVPYNTAWGEKISYGFGGTSLCETGAGEAAFFYLINKDPGLIGAGVAKVTVSNGTPTVVKRHGTKGFWWDSATLPRYGDQAAYRDTRSDYVYAWGGAPTNQKGDAASLIYQTRVHAKHAFDLSKYEYWHGRTAGWNSKPLTTFNSETAVMKGAGQGQVVYNAHYKTYIYVHTGYSQVLLRTADKPEGPWSADVVAWTVPKGLIYAGVAHPYVDASGKTLTVSYTKEPNINEVVKLVFT